MPRRRCVGRTPTTVTPAAGTFPPPGTDIRNVNAPAPATIWSPSNAACMRSTSISFEKRSASSSCVSAPK